MNQLTFGHAEYVGKRKNPRLRVFFEAIESVASWRSLRSLIGWFYLVAGCGGRACRLMTVLRMPLMRNQFGVSDSAMDAALHTMTPVRAFGGLTRAIQDATKILNLRHPSEVKEIAPVTLRWIKPHLSRKGLPHWERQHRRNHKHRDPEFNEVFQGWTRPGDAPGRRGQSMLLRNEGLHWVDAGSDLVQTVVMTPMHEADVEFLELLRGKEACRAYRHGLHRSQPANRVAESDVANRCQAGPH